MNSNKINNLIVNKLFLNVMFISICGAAIFKYSIREIGDIFQTLFFLGSIPFIYVHRKNLIKDKIVLSFFLLSFITLLSWVNSLYKIPEFAKDTPNVFKFFDIFYFIIISFWLGGNQRKILIYWFCALIGFLLACIVKSDAFIHEFFLGLNGQRIDYNVHNAQHTGMIAGFLFLISLYLLANINYFSRRLSIKTPLLISITLLSLFCLSTAIFSQSRQVWLSLFVVMTMSPFIYLYLKNKINIKSIALSTIFIIGSIYLFSQSTIIEKRISSESKTLQAIIHQNYQHIPYTSIGIRVNFWFESIPWIKDSPIIGIGEDARELVISESPRLPQWVKNKFWHLHNSHIETIVSYGFIGLFIIYFSYFWIIKTSIKSKHRNYNDMMFISILFIAYWLVVNNFESFFFWKSGEYIINIVLAGLYTTYLHSTLNYSDNKNDS